jgi:hypothetical protein
MEPWDFVGQRLQYHITLLRRWMRIRVFTSSVWAAFGRVGSLFAVPDVKTRAEHTAKHFLRMPSMR